MTADPNYPLSDRQNRFVTHATAEGFEVDYGYSGRGMYGTRCPAVRHDHGDFVFKGACQDQMGRRLVTYMR